MTFLSFIRIAILRLRSRLLLSLLVLFTMALTVAITVCIPAFSGAVSLHIMQEEIDRRSNVKGLPVFAIQITAEPTTRFPLTRDQIEQIRDRFREAAQRALRLPLLSTSIEVESQVYRLTPQSGDTSYDSDYLAGVRVVVVEGAANVVEITQGAPLDAPSTDPDRLGVWVQEDFLNEIAMNVGERYILGGLYSSAESGIPVEIRGAFRVGSGGLESRSLGGRYRQDLLTSADEFERHVAPQMPEGAALVAWQYVFDEGRLNLSRAVEYIAALQGIDHDAQRTLPSGKMGIAPMEELLRGHQRKVALSLVLYGFTLPVLIFLLMFAASLSAMQARYQEQETATLVSRGAMPPHILGLAGAETLVLILLALPLGTALGLLLALGLGYAGSFLTFIERAPLTVSLSSVDWVPVLAMVGANLVVRLVTAWRVRHITVITHSRGTARNSQRRSALRFFYLILLGAVTFYAYRQLQQRGVLALSSLDALDPRNDPLLLLAPTLFLVSAPLLALEAFQVVTLALGFIGRFLPSVTGYLGLVNLARGGRYVRLPIYVLIMSLSMGVFYASMARSADLWLVDSQRYAHGADLTFAIGPKDDGIATSAGALTVPTVPEEEYLRLPGVLGATRVGDFPATVHGARDVANVRLLAVNRVSFPGVAYYRNDYATSSLGELMNRLAQTPNGVLMPRSLMQTLALNTGDTLRLNVQTHADALIPLDFTIVGAFDYFPTMYPDEAAVVITDLSHLEFRVQILAAVDTLPYSMWLRLDPEADTESVMRGVQQMLLMVPDRVEDLRSTLAAESIRLERTGIFGMLTVCFLAGTALSIANLLVQSTLMLHERALKHAVLRALGVSMSSVLKMVVLESVVALVYGVTVGVATGIWCARLYVPFFAVGGSSSAIVPPFLPVIDWIRTYWIAGAMMGAMLVTQAYVLVRLIQARLFEALRMGQPV